MVKMSERKSFGDYTPEELAKLFGEVVKKTIEGAKGKSDDWALASKPFERKTEKEKEAEKHGSLISRPKAETDAKKPMEFFKTGTFIDIFFLDEKDNPANGIPAVVQMGIVGLPDVGKSILAQEIALRVASEGKRVVFVTSEDIWESQSSRFDLQSRMKQKADKMGLDWETIRNSLFVFDTITNSELRDWNTFVETYRYLVEILKGVDLLIIDSITLMDSYRGALKYRLMELSRYNQQYGITAIYICQRSIEETDKYAMAGGIGLAHNLDATLCIDAKKAAGQLKADLNLARPKEAQIKQWDEVNFTRMLGCRLCGFDRRYYGVEIAKDGFIRIIKPSEVEQK